MGHSEHGSVSFFGVVFSNVAYAVEKMVLKTKSKNLKKATSVSIGLFVEGQRKKQQSGDVLSVHKR